MNFDQALARTGRFEAGFQDDPNDRGNWTGGQKGVGELRGTKFGISAAAYPKLDIKNLTWEEASALYEQDYWIKAGCNALHENIRGEIFDVAVLSGVVRAVRCLQKATGLLTSGIDGSWGPRTQWAVEQVDPETLLRRFDGHFLDFLNDNIDQWNHYGRGWVQRAAERMIATP